MTTPEVQDPEPQDGGPLEPKSFSQEDLNRMVGEARRKEREKYADYEAYKARAAKADELEQEKLTETERLQQKATEAGKKAEDAETRISAMAIRTDIQMKAVLKGIVDPEAAVALIDRAGIQYADERVTGVDEALDALVAAKPYLVAQRRAPNMDNGRQSPSTPLKLTDAERATADKFGISHEDYAKNKPAPNAG
jgi:hypothetical protein